MIKNISGLFTYPAVTISIKFMNISLSKILAVIETFIGAGPIGQRKILAIISVLGAITNLSRCRFGGL